VDVIRASGRSAGDMRPSGTLDYWVRLGNDEGLAVMGGLE